MKGFKVFEMPRAVKGSYFSSSKDAYDYCYRQLSKADREMFIVIFLNSQNKIIGDEVSSIGTVNSSAVYPREIAKSAILNRASSIICLHNHPSGSPEPSEADDIITKEIMFAMTVLQIRMLDHLVIGDGKFYSYADTGKIDDYKKRSEETLKLCGIE